MFTLPNNTLFLYAESAIHAGIGSGLGGVDMPIQRERTTNYPIIQSSGVKGALRQLCDDKHGGEENTISNAVFGEQDAAGAISPGDARILLFPVRALKGVFVWVTCPYVLARYQRDTRKNDLELPQIPKDYEALVSSKHILVSNQIMLEEFTYSSKQDDVVTEWARYFANDVLPTEGEYDHFRQRLQTHLVLLADDDFRDFVTYATEIITRIKINSLTKTVDKEKGALFTQELLPADTVMYSPVQITNARGDGGMEATKVQEHLHGLNSRFQIGGDETLGRGLVVSRWSGAQ